jgi:hypothetical protein
MDVDEELAAYHRHLLLHDKTYLQRLVHRNRMGRRDYPCLPKQFEPEDSDCAKHE